MKKIFLTLIIFGATVAVVMIFALPAFDNFKTLTSQKQQKDLELKELEDYLVHLKSIAQQIQENSPQLVKIDQALMGDNYIPNLFGFLQGAASGSAVSISEMKMGPTTVFAESKNVIQREASLKVSGNYGGLKDFLTTIGKSARIIEILKMSVSISSGEGAGSKKTPVPEMELNVKVYSYQS